MASNHQTTQGNRSPPKPKPSRLIAGISILRALTGVTCFLAPHFSLGLLFMDEQAANNTILPRIFGIREIAIGVFTGLVYRAVTAPAKVSDGEKAQEPLKVEIRRQLLQKVLLGGNVLVDGGDALACALAWVASAQGEVAAASFLGPAAAFATVLDIIALRSLY